jgi:hypothetical protein
MTWTTKSLLSEAARAREPICFDRPLAALLNKHGNARLHRLREAMKAVTPLAHYLTRQVVIDPAQPRKGWADPADRQMLQRALDDVHCFEVSTIDPLVKELKDIAARADNAHLDAEGWEADPGQSRGAIEKELCGTLGFLPAPKTWVEWRYYGSHRRVAVLFEAAISEPEARTLGPAPRHPWHRLTLFWEGGTSPGGYASGDLTKMPPCVLKMPSGWWVKAPRSLADVQRFNSYVCTYATICLVLINSPRIIEQESKPAHRRLAREMRKHGLPKPGVWHEIKLQVTKPREIDDRAASGSNNRPTGAAFRTPLPSRPPR